MFNEIKTYFKFISLKSRVRIGRSNYQRCSVRKGVLRNFAKFTWKHLCQSLFFNKVATPFFTEHLWWLLLEAGDFLNIFSCFGDFRGLFPYKKFSYKKKSNQNKTKKQTNKQNKYSCIGPPAFQSRSCRLRFS